MIPKTRNTPIYRRFPLLLLSLSTMLLTFVAQAGTLRLGTPVINGNQYTFPVLLQGDVEGVAALDFRLAYDPSVFTPVGADSGRSAIQAQKQVSSNVSAPGEFVVVLMGFNQSTVAPGEVVELVLEKIGEPADGNTLLRIAEPTLATSVGVEVDSRGSGRRVRFDSLPVANDDKDEAISTPKPTRDSTDTLPALPDNISGETGSPVLDGPVFITPSDYQPPVETPVKPRAPKSAGGDTKKAPASPRTVTGTSEPTDRASSGFTVLPASGPQSADTATTPKTQGDGDINGSITEKSATDTQAQPAEIKEVTDATYKNIDQNEKKGRQGGGKYATLVLLALGVPLGLFVVLRVAGK